MQREQKHKIVQQLKERMALKRLSQNEAATSIKISNALLSQMINGNWDKISDQKWLLVQAWTGFTEWQRVKTASVKRVFGICSDAQRNAKSLAISDEPGVGKSDSLKWYASERPSVYYVEAEEYWTKKVFLKKILTVMSCDNEGSIAELVDRVINHLIGEEQPLLIIDEADKLKDGVIQLFKTFYNKTEGQAGFVLAGAPYFAARVTKGCNRNKQAYKEIYSRLGGEFIRLRNISKQDIQNIALANGVGETYLPELMEQMSSTTDLRVIKRDIQKYLINQALEARANS